jgi:hypothetical protein
MSLGMTEPHAESVATDLKTTAKMEGAGESVEILKNRIAEHAFDFRFDQRPRHADAQ